VCDVISRGTSSQDATSDDRHLRIVESPFHRVLTTLALHDCLNPAARDNVTFNLPRNWNQDPGTGGQVHCMASIFEIPLQNGLLDQKHPLKPARWKIDSQLRHINQRTMEETVIPVATAAVPKNSVVAKPVLLDDYVRDGENQLRVQSIGERFCLVVQLVASRDIGEVLAQISSDADPVENLQWGKDALLQQLGHGEDDDDIVVTELEVSLKDPLSCARIKTPARGQVRF